MRFLGLIALILVRAVLGIPRALLRSTIGLGYRSRFEIAGRTVERPVEFRSKAHKRAFEDVGRYVTDALTRDVMLSFQDKYLLNDTFWGRKKVPLAVWHEVLAFYAREGCIEPRWELGLPSYGEHLSTPSWGPQGERIGRAASNPIGGLVPDSTEFCPSLLNDGQRRDLLGKPYALHPSDTLKEKAPTYVTLEERHFALTYIRPRKDLSEKSLKEGAKTLQRVFGA